MKKLVGTFLSSIIAISCNHTKVDNAQENSKKSSFQEVTTEEYDLSKPRENAKAVLVLFGGYPEKTEDIKREFMILEVAKNKDVAVVIMNYNQKLWLEESEKVQLAEQLQIIFRENKLPLDNIYIGGFSSGGNVALLISDFIIRNGTYRTKPKGIFIVDAPVDLAELYHSAEKNVKLNFSEISVQEGKWLLETLGKKLGHPTNTMTKYENYSVFTSKTNYIDNLKHLKNTKIRFYTEPDTVWWKKNRRMDYEQMNAYHINKLSEELKQQGFAKVEYICTKDRGYRANGERHPHSWAIVDEQDLINWILKE